MLRGHFRQVPANFCRPNPIQGKGPYPPPISPRDVVPPHFPQSPRFPSHPAPRRRAGPCPYFKWDMVDACEWAKGAKFPEIRPSGLRPHPSGGLSDALFVGHQRPSHEPSKGGHLAKGGLGVVLVIVVFDRRLVGEEGVGQTDVVDDAPLVQRSNPQQAGKQKLHMLIGVRSRVVAWRLRPTPSGFIASWDQGLSIRPVLSPNSDPRGSLRSGQITQELHQPVERGALGIADIGSGDAASGGKGVEQAQARAACEAESATKVVAGTG